MTRICGECGSSIVEGEYDELDRIVGYRCGMCGSAKSTEGEAGGKRGKKKNRKEQEDQQRVIEQQASTDNQHLDIQGGNMPTGKCTYDGCDKWVSRDHYCMVHYRAVFGKSPKSRCAVVGCEHDVWMRGMCQKHKKQYDRGVELTLKEGADLEPKRKGRRSFGESSPLCDQAASPDEGKIIRVGKTVSEFPAVRPAFSATLSQEVYDMEDGDSRKASIVFSYIDGQRVFAECRYQVGSDNHYSLADWVFLGVVSLEIRRLSNL